VYKSPVHYLHGPLFQKANKQGVIGISLVAIIIFYKSSTPLFNKKGYKLHTLHERVNFSLKGAVSILVQNKPYQKPSFF
jgi:hypothetical protein